MLALLLLPLIKLIFPEGYSIAGSGASLRERYHRILFQLHCIRPRRHNGASLGLVSHQSKYAHSKTPDTDRPYLAPKEGKSCCFPSPASEITHVDDAGLIPYNLIGEQSDRKVSMNGHTEPRWLPRGSLHQTPWTGSCQTLHYITTIVTQIDAPLLGALRVRPALPSALGARGGHEAAWPSETRPRHSPAGQHLLGVSGSVHG